MHRVFWFACLTAVAQAAVAPEPAQIRHAVERSILLLQKTGQTWFAQQSCTSCHHSILPAIALMTARRHGIAIDESLARAHFQQAFRYLTDLDFSAQGLEIEGLRPATYALWSAHEAGLPQNQASTMLVRIIASHQTPDGHWRSLDVRLPQSGSLFSNTALSVQAINWYYGPRLDSKTRERISRARRWFETNVPASTEDWAFRLIGGRASDVPVRVRKEWARQLITLQGPDGGWSQIASRSSDAYATGEVLVALIQGGGIAVTDSAIQKGLDFLVRTQLTDGSWLVESRIHDAPLSPPYFESGFPHGKNQFTSSSGTSWAVIALSLALPESPIEPFSLRDILPSQDRWVDVALFGSISELRKLDPNRSTPEGTTVLMLVASDTAKVKALLEGGANVNAHAKSGFSPLIVACSYGGNTDVIRLLLDHGAQIRPPVGRKIIFDRTPLMQAVVAGDLDQIKLLVNRNADVRQKSQIFSSKSPLQIAVYFNDLQTVEYFAEHGASVSEPEESGVTPLERAALMGYAEMIELLARLGADPNHVDDFGMTPLIWASTIEFDEPAAAKALLKVGARPDVAGKGGVTALSQATKYRIEGIRTLLQQSNSK